VTEGITGSQKRGFYQQGASQDLKGGTRGVSKGVSLPFDVGGEECEKKRVLENKSVGRAGGQTGVQVGKQDKTKGRENRDCTEPAGPTTDRNKKKKQSEKAAKLPKKREASGGDSREGLV